MQVRCQVPGPIRARQRRQRQRVQLRAAGPPEQPGAAAALPVGVRALRHQGEGWCVLLQDDT